MAIEMVPPRPDFVARVSGMDLVHGMSEEAFATLRRALDEHWVLSFPDQPIDGGEQIAFSRWWGPLEDTEGVNPASGTP